MKSLEDVKSALDQLINAVQIMQVEVGNLDDRFKTLQDLELRLLDKKSDMDKKEKQLEKEKKQQEEQREYVRVSNIEIDKKKETLSKETIKMEDERLAIIAQKKILEKQEEGIKKLLQEKDKLEHLKEEIEAKERIIAKEKAIDTERKQILDIREKENQKEALRLQKIAETLGK